MAITAQTTRTQHHSYTIDHLIHPHPEVRANSLLNLQCLIKTAEVGRILSIISIHRDYLLRAGIG
jgi:hypothetical protein